MSSDQPQTPRVVDYILVPLLYFVAARLAVMLTVQPEGTAIVWPPNGVLLAALIRFRLKGYATFAGLTIVAEAIADAPAFTLYESVLFGLINVTEATLAYALLDRTRFNSRFTTPADVVKFVVAAPLVAALVAASLAAFVITYVRSGAASYLESLRIWWLGDAVGLMIVTPLLLGLWGRPRPAVLPPSINLRAIDIVVGVGALTTLLIVIVARDGRLLGMHVGPVLLLPFVIFVAVRLGVTSAALAAAGTALLIIVLTRQGYTLFGSLTPRGAIVLAQEFIFITSLLALGPAALMAQLRASQGALEVANAELSHRADALEHSNQDLRRAEAEVVALNAGLEERVHARTAELEQALAQVKRLQGLLPLCAWCKKVRDDHDYWQSVEDYVVRHTDTRFSHSICPDCSETLLRKSNPTSA